VVAATTEYALRHDESPKAALAKAPKLAVAKVAGSIKKLAMEVKPGTNGSGAERAVHTTASGDSLTEDQSISVSGTSEGDPAAAKPFEVWPDAGPAAYFKTFAEAVSDAKAGPNAHITYQSPQTVVWSQEAPSGQAHIDVPLIEQMPELERGSEVTSLAMLLQSAGIDADKMTLAQQVPKDPTPLEVKNGVLHFGNPNRGFVGDIISFDNPGFGVYHGPIKQLADPYMPGRVIDATGVDFADLYAFLDKGAPVWTIVNMDYKTLSDDDFEQWQTPDGPIAITYKEQSVLVTGYDDEYIYINDPMNETDKVEKDSFIAAWEQMGKQAISYVPNSESKAGKT
jgi:uncharacterized protein YvpB